MRCPKCETEISSGATSCPNCGVRISTRDDPGTQALSIKSIQPAHHKSPPAIQAEGYERRMVTILFADIVSFSTLSEHIDPEELLEIMRQAYPCLLEPVQDHAGTVVQVMGDGVLAYFGTPLAQENDPERAVIAGLEIVERVKAYARRLRQERRFDKFNVRVGIIRDWLWWGICIQKSIWNILPWATLSTWQPVCSRMLLLMVYWSARLPTSK